MSGVVVEGVTDDFVDVFIGRVVKVFNLSTESFVHFIGEFLGSDVLEFLEVDFVTVHFVDVVCDVFLEVLKELRYGDVSYIASGEGELCTRCFLLEDVHLG